MPAILKEIGVALLVAFVFGAIVFLGQLVYAQLVLMPRQITSGSALAVAVDIRWAIRSSAVAFAAYLIWRLVSRHP